MAIITGSGNPEAKRVSWPRINIGEREGALTENYPPSDTTFADLMKPIEKFAPLFRRSQVTLVERPVGRKSTRDTLGNVFSALPLYPANGIKRERALQKEMIDNCDSPWLLSPLGEGIRPRTCHFSTGEFKAGKYVNPPFIKPYIKLTSHLSALVREAGRKGAR